MKKLTDKSKRFWVLLVTPFLLLAGVTALCVVCSGAGKTKIYFYSTEANINNFKSLKMEFDRYLSKLGPYEFQPFNTRDTFEKQVKGKDNCLVLMSSWHYRHIHKPYNLTAALAGLQNGRKYQRRIVVRSVKVSDIQGNKKGVVASASSLEYTSSALKNMLSSHENLSFQVLTVPKDIDALMSVGFGMAKMAFASDMALEELKGINPRLGGQMKILAQGEETLRLIMALPKGFSGDRQKMIQIIKNMGTSPEGQKRIRMLGLDGWEDLALEDRRKLES